MAGAVNADSTFWDEPVSKDPKGRCKACPAYLTNGEVKAGGLCAECAETDNRKPRPTRRNE